MQADPAERLRRKNPADCVISKEDLEATVVEVQDEKIQMDEYCSNAEEEWKNCLVFGWLWISCLRREEVSSHI